MIFRENYVKRIMAFTDTPFLNKHQRLPFRKTKGSLFLEKTFYT